MATDDASQDDYFISYGNLSVHELMLKDRPRTQAYRKFIEANLHLVKGKIVMDVGAGTGILSLFAASAGAKKVFAVEASSVARLCEEIVLENNLGHIIEVIHGTVETISLPSDIQHVDVIISEWMGFYLLHESMLDSVIVARDRFLAPDGLMLPSHASLFFAPVDMSDHFQNRADEWSNIYGFDFSPVASQINMEEVSKPLITHLDPKVLCSEPQEIRNLNLKSVTAEDVQTISTVLKFPIQQDSKIFGFAAWFSVEFNAKCETSRESHVIATDEMAGSRDVNEQGDSSLVKGSCVTLEHSVPATQHGPEVAPRTSTSVLLSTGPHDLATHWKQTVVFLPRTILVEGGVNLCCRVRMSQSSTNKRHYNINVALVGEDDDDAGQTSDDCDSDDSTDHPVPCDCGSDRCRLISALVDKYEDEYEELDDGVVQVTGQIETATEMEEDSQIDGQLEGSSG